jgi:hypothetical protein
MNNNDKQARMTNTVTKELCPKFKSYIWERETDTHRLNPNVTSQINLNNVGLFIQLFEECLGSLTVPALGWQSNQVGGKQKNLHEGWHNFQDHVEKKRTWHVAIMYAKIKPLDWSQLNTMHSLGTQFIQCTKFGIIQRAGFDPQSLPR